MADKKDSQQGGNDALPSQESINLLTQLLQDLRRSADRAGSSDARRSTGILTDLPSEVKRDVDVVVAAFASIKSALELGDSPITISGLSRRDGSPTGGDSVTISGNGFLPGATVFFGTNPATNVSVAPFNSIDVITPAKSPGGPFAVDVVVHTLAGSASMRGFTYSS